MKNNNNKIIQKLSRQSLKNNKMRNLFAIAAISLTALLFTALFSIGLGMIQVTEEQTMRQVGTVGHAGLKHVTKAEYDKITSNPLVKESSYNIFIGMASNDELKKRQTELRYTEPEDLKYHFMKLKQGRLPVEEDEIVVDTIVMDMLKVPHEIGAKIPLKFDFMGKMKEETFNVSGWYEGDPVAGASQIYLSQKYWNKLSADYTEAEFVQAANKDSNGCGLINGTLLFRNSMNIEKKVIRIIEESGYQKEDIDYGINWAYMSEKVGDIDPMSTIIITISFLVILLTGYLIIYNIFHISVVKDIRFYGLLKTTGATKKQIRSLVIRQALLLSCIGIPIGLFMGFLIGQFMMPVFLKAVNGLSTSNFQMKANPYIFLFGMGFSLLTVIISCRKPGKIAGGVSPIEAVRYTDVSNLKRKMKKSTDGAKIYKMALSNMARYKKRSLVVILSMSLSIILLMEVYTFLKGFRLDQYLENMLTGDFMIGSVNLFNHTGDYDILLPDSYYNAVSSQEGIESISRLYHTTGNSHTLSESGHETFKNLYNLDKLDIREFNLTQMQDTLTNNASISEQRYAYDEELLPKLKVLDGNLDLKKFKTGKYILLGAISDLDCSYYKPGDQVELQHYGETSQLEKIKDVDGNTIEYKWTNATKKTYEVMAVVDIPTSMTERSYPLNALISVLPVDELLKNDKNVECFSASINVTEDKESEFQKYLEDYTKQVDPNTDFDSKEGLRDDFSSFTDTIRIVGGFLSFIIAVIGILNFINNMFTSVVTRRQEFAILQSIGLTSGQFKKLLIYEGLYYTGFTAVISLLIGSLLSVSVIRAVNHVTAYFVYHFTVTPLIAVMPVFIIISCAIPVLAYHNVRKQSIIERLRETE